MGGGEHPVQIPQPVHQLHTGQVLRLHPQQTGIVQPLQADHRGHALGVVTQPQRAPRFGQRPAQGIVNLLLGQGLELGQLILQGGLADAEFQQRLPVVWQLIQGGPQLLLRARLVDQLVERQIALQFAHVDQLIEALTEGGLALQQLLLIVGAHQKKLTGGLVAGDSRNGLGFGH